MKDFPESVPAVYDYAAWSADQFYVVGVMIANIAERRDTRNMRQALLNLYFQEQGDDGND